MNKYGIEKAQLYYKSQKEALEKLALDCSRNKTRTLIGYKPLNYEDILAIYKMAYE